MRREERRSQLLHLYRKQEGKCHICKCETVLELRDSGGRLNPKAAVRFRLGSKFGKPGRFRPRVMACAACAQERSDQIQMSQPLDETWARSQRYPTEFWSAGSQSGAEWSKGR